MLSRDTECEAEVTSDVYSVSKQGLPRTEANSSAGHMPLISFHFLDIYLGQATHMSYLV